MKNTNVLDQSGFRITGVGNGTDPSDAVNKGQLDAAIQGFSWKQPVRAATTGNVTLSGTQTIDGVAVVTGDRVLVKLQTAGAGNGIYVVGAGAWTRATDMDTPAEALGAAVFVSEGTVHSNQQWVMTTDAPITLGTTALVWSQVGAGVSYTAGNGISIVGSVISLDPAVATRKASGTIGDGTATTFSINHGLNTLDIQVSIREVSTGAEVLCDNVANSVNTVQLTFGSAPATGQYRVTVQG